MKPAVAFVAAFVLATAAATGASAKLHPAPKPPPAPADSAVSADSTKSDSASADSSSSPAGGDSTLASKIVDTAHVLSISPTGGASPTVTGAQKNAAAPGTAGGATGGTTGGASAAARPIAVPALPVAGAPRTAAASSTTPPDTASQHHLAKLFASMQPKEAAQVLQRMGDDDVQIILGYVGTRQAAAILAELPPDRVATLSKLALRAGTGGRVK